MFLLLSWLCAAPASAQQIATSPGPERVSVTVYRVPGRPAAQKLQLAWLNGYALITETRRVSLPAGEADLRFEGVAGGILPESAIVTGLPSGVVEKNQDAWLLSPASLLDRSLGRRVHLRRTSRATGAVRDIEAVVRSGPAGAVVIETPDGIEALRCSGLPETLVYDRVPPGLSAKPTLSVRVRSARPASAVVTLSYLSSGFDWQADYVARLSADEKRLDLFAWLTLANGDETGFRNAEALAVAGRVNRSYTEQRRARAEPLRLECWPQGTTSDVPESDFEREEIVVTGTRMMAMAPPPPPPPPPASAPPPPPPVAEQEDLGDLKLYRFPIPVTVAAKSQKQVAMLERASVRVDPVYRARFYAPQPGASVRPRRILVARNSKEGGLGLPLPSGQFVLFNADRERPILLGRGSLEDKAVGEEVEIDVGAATAVQVQVNDLRPRGQQEGEVELTVSNARPEPIRFEAEFLGSELVLTSETTLARRNGLQLWTAQIPANGTRTFRYRTSLPPPPPAPIPIRIPLN